MRKALENSHRAGSNQTKPGVLGMLALRTKQLGIEPGSMHFHL